MTPVGFRDSFSTAFSVTLRFEGGLANDKFDPGGQTRYGISKKQYPHLDIERLTIFDAKEIYRQDYWFVHRCNELPHALAVVLFDAVVNHQAKKPIQWLQRAVGAKADGVMGNETIRLANRDGLDIPGAARDFTVARLEYVKTLSI